MLLQLNSQISTQGQVAAKWNAKVLAKRKHAFPITIEHHDVPSFLSVCGLTILVLLRGLRVGVQAE
jgi:hypothetical protein